MTRLTDELATIAALQLRIDELGQENEILKRNTVRASRSENRYHNETISLQKQNAQMVALIAAYGLHLQGITDGLAATKGQYRGATAHVLRGFSEGLMSEWNGLKEKHLKTEATSNG